MNITGNKRELSFIALIWILIYASDPLYMIYREWVGQFTFSWDKIFPLWGSTSLFLALFLLHHFVFIPRFFIKKRKWLYGISVALCLMAFTVYLAWHSPHPHIIDAPIRRAMQHVDTGWMLMPPDLARLVMAMLMIGVDLGTVGWVREQRLHQQVLQLEKQHLKQELEQLRYQINPHFFMNTLNNIHALIDIDQERAKRAIVELSGLMRYALYEGKDTLIPVQHEADFLRQYISLMKIRYNDKLKLECQMPQCVPADAMMPPLLLATFVENSFKHGVSYQRPSFIRIMLQVDAEKHMIQFRCENSRHSTKQNMPNAQRGIGLENVHKRLELQYATQYSLTIDESDPTRYVVDLKLPYN